MQTAFFYLTSLAVAAVFVVLLLGLGNLLRTNSANMSQTLMRWRIVLQFIAIIVLMIAVYFMRQ